MTLEEIKEAVKEKSKLRKEIVLWAKDTDEGKEVLNNFAKVQVDKAIDEKTSEIHTSYDNDLFEVLGERKKNDQKTYDYVKSIASELKELREKKGSLDESQKVKDLQAEIKKMKDSGESNNHWKEIHNEAQKKWEKEKETLESNIQAKESEYLSAQVEADLQSGRSGLKFKEGIPEEAINAMIEAEKKRLLENAKIVDGEVVYHDEEGKPLMNEEYKQVSSKEIWEDKLNKLLDTGSGNDGGGKAPKTPSKSGSVTTIGEGDNAKKKLSIDMEGISTRLEFTNAAEKALKAQGFEASSDEYQNMLVDAYNEYKVSELDLQ